MRCYYHPDAEAVGLCRSCGKGLCRGCAVDLGQGLACQNSCETQVRDLIVQLHVSRQALATTPQSYRTQSTVALITASVFFAAGSAFALSGAWVMAPLFGLLGLPMLYQGVRARRMHRALAEATRQLPPPR